MRKTYSLAVEGKHPDRVLDAVKHDIRKYFRRERRRSLPEGAQFWDFDCRFGATADAAEAVPESAITGLVDGVARSGGSSFYLEILAKPGARKPRAEGPVAGA